MFYTYRRWLNQGNIAITTFTSSLLFYEHWTHSVFGKNEAKLKMISTWSHSGLMLPLQGSSFQAESVRFTISVIIYYSLKWFRIVDNSTSKWKKVMYICSTKLWSLYSQKSKDKTACIKWTKMRQINYYALSRHNKQRMSPTWSTSSKNYYFFTCYADKNGQHWVWKTLLPVAPIKRENTAILSKPLDNWPTFKTITFFLIFIMYYLQ